MFTVSFCGFLILCCLLFLLAGKVRAEEKPPGEGENKNPPGEDKDKEKQEKDIDYWKQQKRESDNEAKNLRTRIKEMEDKLKGFEDSQKTETQKLLDRVEAAEKKALELEGKAKSSTLVESLIKLQQQFKFHSVHTIKKLLEGEIEYDDKGQPTGLEEKLKSLIEENPYLSAEYSPGGGNNNQNPPRKAGTGTLTMDDVKKMSRAEIAARQEEVDKVLQSAAK